MSKKVVCASTSCPGRRKHHDEPYTPRGPQMIEVPDDFEGLAYCSIECSMYGKSENRVNPR